MKELFNRRTKTMKVFEKAPGERLYRCHIGNIHYPDSAKKWQDIDTTLLSKAGGFYQDKNFYSCEIPDRADGEFVFFNHDHYFNLKLVGVSGIGYKPIPGSRWGELGKGVRYTDAFGSGIHFEVIVANMRFEKRICFEKPPADITKDFIFEYEILNAPDRFEFKDNMLGSVTIIDSSKNLQEALSIENKITSIYSSTGKYKSLIHFPRCYDSNPDNRLTLPVKILFYSSGGKFYLRKIIPKEIFKNAVYPVFADDPTRYDPPAGDGNIENGSYLAWNTAHDATSGAVYDTFTEIESGGLRGAGGVNCKIMRGFIPIDTSGIADGDTVITAIFYMYGKAPTKNDDNDGEDWISTVQTTNSDPDNLVANDFNNCGDTVDNPTEGNDTGNRIDIGSWSTVAYNTIALNAIGLGWVDKTSYTKLGVREGHDCLDHELLGGNYQGNRVKIFASEETGTSKDPYLDVTVSGGQTHELKGSFAGQGALVGILILDRSCIGTITATSAVSGGLRAIRSLAGNIAAASSLSAKLICTRALSGAIAATSALSGSLKAIRSLAGAVAASASVTGGIRALRSLAGTIAATSAVTGALSLAGKIILAGTIAAISAVSGSLQAIRSLAGALSSSASITGRLRALRGLAGTIAGSSALSARLICTRALSGAIAATSAISGALTLAGKIMLAGAIAATSAVSGSLRAVRSLAGALSSSASITGRLRALRGLAGTIAGSSALSARLICTRALSGAIAGISSVTGRLIPGIIVDVLRRIFTKDTLRREFTQDTERREFVKDTERRIFNIK